MPASLAMRAIESSSYAWRVNRSAPSSSNRRRRSSTSSLVYAGPAIALDPTTPDRGSKSLLTIGRYRDTLPTDGQQRGGNDDGRGPAHGAGGAHERAGGGAAGADCERRAPARLRAPDPRAAARPRLRAGARGRRPGPARSGPRG